MLNPETLFRYLKTRQINRLCLAYSGGLDSHTLLHVLHTLLDALPVLSFGASKGEGDLIGEGDRNPAFSLRAVHVNHGLSPNADAWSSHCQRVCQALNVPCLIKNVAVSISRQTQGGGSMEEIARVARYQAFAEVLEEGECLLMAHTQDDQAETVLQQLFRGAGVKGLS